jgi:hypothetical protein
MREVATWSCVGRKGKGSLLINDHHRAELAWRFAPRLFPTSELMAQIHHAQHVHEPAYWSC